MEILPKGSMYLFSISFICFIMVIPQSHSQNYLKTINKPCSSWGVTGLFIAPSDCRFHLHCSSGENYVIDTSGFVVGTYYPYPSSSFSHTGMSISPTGGLLWMLRDLSPLAFGPGAELWQVNLTTNTGQFVANLDPVTTWETWGLAENPFNGNLLIGEANNQMVSNSRLNINFITEITPSGIFVDTIVTRHQMDSLGLEAGGGGLEINPKTNELVFSAWSGVNAGKLYSINLQTKVISVFFNSGFVGPNGPMGITFTSTGDFALINPTGIHLYDIDNDSQFSCNPVLLYPGENSAIDEANKDTLHKSKGIVLSHNPTSGIISIQSPVGIYLEVTLITPTGCSLASYSRFEEPLTMEISMEMFPTGLYYFCWDNGINFGVKKVIKW